MKMKKNMAFHILFACLVASAFGQQDVTGFLRVSSPSNAVITGFDPFVGTLTCSNEVAGATNQIQRSFNLTGTSNWVDFIQMASTSSVVTDMIIDLDPPEGMAFIPGGIFQMGDSLTEGIQDERPVHSVYVSPFYMGKYEVDKTLWDEVYNWATNHGYSFYNAGSAKAADHPVNLVNWYDTVKWCNARSEMAGLTPCYLDAIEVYRTGQLAPTCLWSANGYRLPTEAEWEKAARGGANDNRFDWGFLITHSNANYRSSSSYGYDVSLTRGYHPDYAVDGFPYTNPVDAFSPNGYGLHNTVGNVLEWCWDIYGSSYYSSSPASNPRGATAGGTRVERGGSYLDQAGPCRTARRTVPADPALSGNNIGFRVCLPAN